MDKIANAVSDMCALQIIPDVTFQTIEGKCIVQIEIYPGQNRPYYIRSMGKGKSYDEIVNVEINYDEKQALKPCYDIRKYIAESKELPIGKVREITVTNLENWGILVRVGAIKKGKWSVNLCR